MLEQVMKARIKWIENVAFVGETESGHALVMDGSPEAGGRNLGPRPMETVLIGTGACAPCSKMEETVAVGAFQAMRGHGGITASVERGGAIRVGDAVRAIGAK